MREFKKSTKLDNVLYDVRGPVVEEAFRMEEAGTQILKLNIGNPAFYSGRLRSGAVLFYSSSAPSLLRPCWEYKSSCVQRSCLFIPGASVPGLFYYSSSAPSLLLSDSPASSSSISWPILSRASSLPISSSLRLLQPGMAGSKPQTLL